MGHRYPRSPGNISLPFAKALRQSGMEPAKAVEVAEVASHAVSEAFDRIETIIVTAALEDQFQVRVIAWEALRSFLESEGDRLQAALRGRGMAAQHTTIVEIGA
jgi:hypothetical protein